MLFKVPRYQDHWTEDYIVREAAQQPDSMSGFTFVDYLALLVIMSYSSFPIQSSSLAGAFTGLSLQATTP